jgi:hypothetical protein
MVVGNVIHTSSCLAQWLQFRPRNDNYAGSSIFVEVMTLDDHASQKYNRVLAFLFEGSRGSECRQLESGIWGKLFEFFEFCRQQFRGNFASSGTAF